MGARLGTSDPQLPVYGGIVPAVLTILDGPDAGQRISLGRRTTLGRSSHCDVTLANDSVSREHAEIVATPDGYLLRDLESSNGTFVDGARIDHFLLHHDAELRCSDVPLRFQLQPSPEERAARDSVILTRTPRRRTTGQVAGKPEALQTALLSTDARQAERASVRLHELQAITQQLTRLRNLEALYPLILDEVMRVVPAQRGVLLRVDADGELEPKVARNSLDLDGVVEVSQTVVDEVTATRLSVFSPEATSDPALDLSESVHRQRIRSLLCVPITYDESVLGALYLDILNGDAEFTAEDLHFVSGVAAIGAVSMSNALGLQEVRLAGEALDDAFHSMLDVIANAIEARDHYTIGHTWRVARIAQTIARHLGWSGEKVREVEIGGMLHDIGKIGVPDAILRKPGALTNEEHDLMKLHPEIGARMLRGIPSLDHVVPYVLYHQEKYDGTGYPHGLQGADIPIEARLIAVADALDAMTSSRAYRRGMEPGIAIAELQRQAGTQCDPEIVDALVRAYEADDLTPFFQLGLRALQDVICPYCSTYCAPEQAAIDRGEMECETCSRLLQLKQIGDRVFAQLA